LHHQTINNQMKESIKKTDISPLVYLVIMVAVFWIAV